MVLLIAAVIVVVVSFFAQGLGRAAAHRNGHYFTCWSSIVNTSTDVPYYRCSLDHHGPSLSCALVVDDAHLSIMSHQLSSLICSPFIVGCAINIYHQSLTMNMIVDHQLPLANRSTLADKLLVVVNHPGVVDELVRDH